MSYRRIILTLALIAGLTGLSGCSLFRSWGWVDPSESWQQSASDRITQEQQAQAQAAAEAAASSDSSWLDGVIPSFDPDSSAPSPSSENISSSSSSASSLPSSLPSTIDSSKPVAPMARPTSASLSGHGSGGASVGERVSLMPVDAASGSPTNMRQVTFAQEGADFDPDIDPTGQYLVYASTRHRSASAIYLQKVDALAVTQLTTDPSNNAMPAFSPDGKRIAFASDRTGNWDIFVMTVDGGSQPVQITSDAAADISPRFSPDGRWLIYTTLSSQSGQWEMVLVDLEKPGSRRYIGQGVFPCWSPRGERIVYQKAKQRGTRWFSLWTVDLVNGEAVRPTEIISSSHAACITPRFSPDGQKLVFAVVVDPDGQAAQSGDRPTRSDIHIVSLDGSNRINLTQSRSANLQPVWASEGTIYFVSSQGHRGLTSRETIWSVRPDRAMQAATATSLGSSAGGMGAAAGGGSGKAHVMESPRSTK